jgi:deoxyribodipyrimidine photolyase
MRAELFVKDTSSLITSARFLFSAGAHGINLPNKASASSAPELAPTAALRALAEALTPTQLEAVCPHYSLKFNSAGANSAATLKNFEDFCREAARLHVRQCLLVSGSGSRKFDCVECLKSLRLPPESRPAIGVAFNPFCPDRASRQREQARLRQKLGTGAVSAVWLQIGSDAALLSEALDFVQTLKQERQLPALRLYGSVFLPSKRLLAQMKFRPWNGVFLSSEYLSSVEAAEAITRGMLGVYHAHGVELLLESSISKREEWQAAVQLCAPSDTGPADGRRMPTEGPIAPSASIPLSASSSTSPLCNAVAASAPQGSPTAGSRAASHDGASYAATPPPATTSTADCCSTEPVGVTPRSKRLRPSDGIGGSRAPGFDPTLPDAATVDGAVDAVSAEPAPPSEAGTLSLVWFRSFDVRLTDHAPLLAAAGRGAVVPCFVWPAARGEWAPGGAAQAWLKTSVASLDHDLRHHLNSRLTLRLAPSVGPDGASDVADGCMAAARAACAEVGPISGAESPAAELEAMLTAAEVLLLARECDAGGVYFHRSYEPEGQRVERVVACALRSAGVAAEGMPGHLLYEHSEVQLSAGWSGGHWGTLMPFLKACERSASRPARPASPPTRLVPPSQWPHSSALACLGLAAPPVRADGGGGRDWGANVMQGWVASETEAVRLMCLFVDGDGLRGYESRRSRADVPEAVSRLSPYLRFGQLSARQLYHAVRDTGLARDQVKTFSRRLHWRDLAYFQLHTFPRMAWQPIRAHYHAHGWSSDAAALRAWQRGRTGFPMVDAGMRCLWATGWMHQSVRMVTASFLVEYLGISWVEGARWFHDTLVDADVAINAMMWQNAGRSGIDQWNFVLSPETGSQDPTGEYVRRWVPELAQLPLKHLHAPWRAPEAVLSTAGVELGVTYPDRIVPDLEAARKDTVAALLRMRAEALEFNDPGGYDLITLPGGERTRLFTKQEFRLTAGGDSKAPPGATKQQGRGRGVGRGRGRSSGRGRASATGDGDTHSIKKYMRR